MKTPTYVGVFVCAMQWRQSRWIFGITFIADKAPTLALPHWRAWGREFENADESRRFCLRDAMAAVEMDFRHYVYY